MPSHRGQPVRGHDPGRLGRALGATDDLPLDPDLEADAGSGWRSGSGRRLAPALAAVFAGDLLGTLARAAVQDAWPTPPGHFPAATFVVNTSGAFLLGVLLTTLIERVPVRGRWLERSPSAALRLRAFAGAGLLGGWTTYSTMVVEAVDLGHRDHLLGAAGDLAITLVCGLSAVAAGIGLAPRHRDAGSRLGRERVAAASGPHGGSPNADTAR